MNNQTEKMLRIYEEWNIGARVPDCKPETRQVWYRSIETFKVFGLLIFLGHPFTFHHEGNNKIKSTAEDNRQSFLRPAADRELSRTAFVPQTLSVFCFFFFRKTKIYAQRI